MNSMNTANDSPIVPAIMAGLQFAADTAAQNARNPSARRQARERMNRVREKNRQLFGEKDIGVDIIREMRDGR